MRAKKLLLLVFVSSIVLSLFGQNQILDNSNTMSSYKRVKSLNLGDSICYLGECVYAFGSTDYSDYDPHTFFRYRTQFGEYLLKDALKWGFVNANGYVLEKAKWDRIGASWYKDNTLFEIEKGLYEKEIYGFHDGLIPVGIFKKDKTKRGSIRYYLYGYADTTAKLIIKPAYQVAGPFSEGLAPVAKKIDGLFGYIDKTGKWIIRPQYISAAAFSEGLAAVAYDEEENVVMGYIDNSGKMVLKIDWPSIRREMKWRQTSDNWLGPFINGTADIYANLHYWVVNIEENVEDLHYSCKIDKKGHLWGESSMIFCNENKDESYIAVRRDSLWGVIDYYGNIILPPQRLIPECILNIDSIENPEVIDKVYPLQTFGSLFGSRPVRIRPSGPSGKYLILCSIVDEYGTKKHFYNFNGKLVYEHYDSINVFSKPFIALKALPSEISLSQVAFIAEIKSNSNIEYCKIYLNGVEVQEDNTPGGSSIVEDLKGNENHDITINRTLVLREGKNTIRIKVKNAGGETEEEKTMEYKPDRAISGKAFIVWNDLPATTTESHLELNALVKSTVKEVGCRVLLNGVEVAAPTRGSSIVENPKEPEYKYMVKVQRTFALKENITNTIVIEVKDAQERLLKSEQKQVSYTKPMLATIKWGDVPSYMEEKHLTMRAQIISDSPIEYYSILKGENVLKRVEKNTNVKTRGSEIVEDSEKDGCNVFVEESVELAEGDNSFVIEVKNTAGIVQSMPKVVQYKHKEKRIALVIGNAKYEKNQFFLSLRNPVNDATALANKLKRFGFTVLHVHNGTKEMMNKEIDVFIREAATSDMALFYYSGHGMQIKSKGNDNYMIPVVPPQYVEDIDDACISANDIIDRLRAVNCQAGIILLDACRVEPSLPSKDNPNAPRGTGGVKGLSSMSPQGFITVFAAADNCEAYDGIGNNSPFMESMLECFDNYSQLPIESFFKKVRELTYEKSDKRQWPYVYEGLRGDFYFRNNNKK